MTDSSPSPVATGGETNDVSPSPFENTGQTPSLSESQHTNSPVESREKIWKELLERTKGVAVITDEVRRRLEQELDADTCKECIEGLKKKYEGKRDAKFLKVIEPAAKGLKAFSDGVNTLSKHPTGLSIAWGITQLVLEGAQHSYTILTQITSLIERFTKHLPRYKDYAEMLSEYPRLRDAMTEIYIVYLEMCVHSIAYLKRPPWVNFIRGIFKGGVDGRNFDKLMNDMKECEKGFNKEADYAKYHSLLRHIQAFSAFAGLSRHYQTQENLGWTDAVMRRPRRNSHYYPRGDELEQMKKKLLPTNPKSGGEIRSCVVNGMCGVGKTQLILEFAKIWKGPIFWLEAETQDILTESFCEIARALKLDIEHGNSGQELIEMARQWLSTHNDWLLVYDNAASFEIIKECYWPSLSQGSVIISTQNEGLSLPTSSDPLSLHLRPMNRDEGAKFLLERLKRYHVLGTDKPGWVNEIDILERISDKLRGLPLAIDHGARYFHTPQLILEALGNQPDMFNTWLGSLQGVLPRHRPILESFGSAAVST